MTGNAVSYRCGRDHRLQLVILEPLFEEANRCRRLIAVMMRALDQAGIGSALVTLPGTGECARALSDVAFPDWLAFAGELKADAVASVRGGALLDAAVNAPCHWRFAPETGSRIVRDLRRTALAGPGGQTYAGHKLNAAMLEGLEAATPVRLPHLRTVRLASDMADADLKVEGTPLWRRAEPGEDAALSDLLAADLAAWVKQCAAS